LGRKSYESISIRLSFFMHFLKINTDEALLSLADEN
jgi:hypothetical protein